MIHKQFRLDGTPDFERWIIECDRCQHHIYFYGVCPDCGFWHPNKSLLHWLMPGNLIYCPTCIADISEELITDTITCPRCGGYGFNTWQDDLDGSLSLECDHCGAYTFGPDYPDAINGWFYPDLDA